MTNNSICNDLDLLVISSRNSQNLGVTIKNLFNISKMWKNIYKAGLTREYTRVDNELDNCSNFSYLSNASTGLQRQFILKINIGLISDTVTPCFLDVILPNSNSKIVCNQIHLLLPLNQL